MTKQWDELTKQQTIITDLGRNAEKSKGTVKKYVVWKPDKDRHAIVETSDNLSYLMSKYQVKREYVFRLEMG